MTLLLSCASSPNTLTKKFKDRIYVPCSKDFAALHNVPYDGCYFASEFKHKWYGKKFKIFDVIYIPDYQEDIRKSGHVLYPATLQ